MFDRLIVLLSTLGPLLGSVLVTSRPSRLINRALAYNKLADEIEPTNPDAAATARKLVAELTERIVRQERSALRRRFEIAGVLAWSLLVLPAGVLSYFAWTNPGLWTWPVLIVSALWFGLSTAGTWAKSGKCTSRRPPKASPRPSRLRPTVDALSDLRLA